ncbi:unnamed protein product [Ophioblennius macclurei]
MNLYRSFGNLMEAWVTEENPRHDSPWLRNNSKGSSSSSSYAESNLRSESVDSGVETASCDTVLSASGSVSADHADVDLFAPERWLSPASVSPSSSSSSPRFGPIREENASTGLEEASLQRTDAVHLRDKPRRLTVEEVLGRRPRASLLPKRHTSDLGFGQRSGSLTLRGNPSFPVRQMSDVCRRPLSASHISQSSQGLAMEGNRESSPGLDYLEQVCQMLEGIAREQMQHRGMHAELEAVCEDQDDQTLDAVAEEDRDRTPQRKYGHFRQRSASDTALSTIHLRKLNTHNKAQLMSTTDLLEREEEEDEAKQDSKKTEKSKTLRHWKLKFGSFTKGESAVFMTKSQQMQPAEKTSTRRRLSKLFRRRRKTLPM